MSNPSPSRLKAWIDRYAGTSASTVAASANATAQVKRASLFMLWTIAAFFIVMFVWIAVAEVDTVTRADGRVIPSAKLQVIQNLEGGIVADILVKQGQVVKAGDNLVALSSLQHEGDMKSRYQQLLGLEARAARLVALANGRQPQFPKSVVDTAPDLMAVEMATFLSKTLEQESQLAVLSAQMDQKARELDEAKIALISTRKSLEMAREERATVARLVERGLEPRLELLRIERSFAEQEGRADISVVTIERLRSANTELSARKETLVRQLRTEALSELNRTMAELAAIKEGMPALADKVARTHIKSPMNGIVNRVFVNTVGGIVRPGDPIVDVVPSDDQLVVEALVSPKDIGFVKIGQPARVKVTAYDYSIFGAMDGTVKSISADAVPNEKGEAFFQVRIETNTRAIESIDKKLPIMPGMQAQIDIITGKKTILKYLSKPIVAVQENAFKER
jgi:adhesin transport system membrane fusion protein